MVLGDTLLIFLPNILYSSSLDEMRYDVSCTPL